MHSIPIPHGLLPSRARYASECQAKVLIVFYPTKRSYKISACNLTIRTKTAIFSLQNDYYAAKLRIIPHTALSHFTPILSQFTVPPNDVGGAGLSCLHIKQTPAGYPQGSFRCRRFLVVVRDVAITRTEGRRHRRCRLKNPLLRTIIAVLKSE